MPQYRQHDHIGQIGRSLGKEIVASGILRTIGNAPNSQA
jgi:hypothetical protein